MSKVIENLTSKAIHVRITAEMLVEAFMESLYFNRKVKRIRISMSRFGDKCPTQNVYITCSGRGKMKGRIVNGVFHGTISGTEKDVGEWQNFFKRFIEVPEFSLKDYVAWLQQNGGQ